MAFWALIAVIALSFFIMRINHEGKKIDRAEKTFKAEEEAGAQKQNATELLPQELGGRNSEDGGNRMF